MEESQPAGKEKKSKANKEKAFGNEVIRLLMMIFHFFWLPTDTKETSESRGFGENVKESRVKPRTNCPFLLDSDFERA